MQPGKNERTIRLSRARLLAQKTDNKPGMSCSYDELRQETEAFSTTSTRGPQRSAGVLLM